jgi:hypothetical protein
MMSEPASSAAAGWVGFKLAGLLTGLAAGLSAIVVMCMMTPRSKREWAVGIISTVIGSVAGGAALVQHYHLHEWLQSVPGTVALFGLVFACGLPAWALVRWVFTFIEKRKDHDIGQVMDEVKGKWWPK